MSHLGHIQETMILCVVLEDYLYYLLELKPLEFQKSE